MKVEHPLFFLQLDPLDLQFFMQDVRASRNAVVCAGYAMEGCNWLKNAIWVCDAVVVSGADVPTTFDLDGHSCTRISDTARYTISPRAGRR